MNNQNQSKLNEFGGNGQGTEEPKEHKEPIKTIETSKWKPLIIYCTTIAVLFLAFSIFYYSNPRTIEYNVTHEIIRDIDGKVIEVFRDVDKNTIEITKEVIKEVNRTCEVCKICPPCNESADCVQRYSEAYVLGLIRIAKKCEKSEDTYTRDECNFKLNKTDERLKNCTAKLSNCENSCEGYYDDIEYDFGICKGNLTTCTNTWNICKDNLDSCDNCLDEEEPEDCYAEKSIE